MNLDNYLKKINGWRPVMDQPIGKGLAYGLGFGVSAGLSGLIQKFWATDPRISLAIVAFLVKTKKVESYIGSQASELIATGIWIEILRSSLPLESLGFAPFSLVGAAPAAVAQASAPQQPSALTNSLAAIPIIGPLISGYSMANALTASSEEANQEGLGMPFGYQAETYGLGAPVMLMSAEEKIAGINM